MTQFEVQKIALMTPRNLKALLADMRLSPGTHPIGELYEAYLVLCREVEAAPISKKALGLSLAHQGCTPTTKRVNGKEVRAWMIPRSRFRDVIAGEERPEFSPDSRHPTLADPSGVRP